MWYRCKARQCHRQKECSWLFLQHTLTGVGSPIRIAAMSENEEAQARQDSAVDPRPTPREPSQQAIANRIADELGEHDAHVRFQVLRIVKAIGRTAALSFLAKAKEVEAQGGMLTNDRTRRRSLGGVYFYLVYGEGIVKATGERLHRPTNPNKPKRAPKEKNATVAPQPQIRPMQWEDRLAIIDVVHFFFNDTATTEKITVI